MFKTSRNYIITIKILYKNKETKALKIYMAKINAH